MSYDEKFRKKAAKTEKLLLNYYNYVMANTPSEEKESRQKEMLGMLKAARREFEQNVSKYLWDESANACPDGYKKCRAGVCVPVDEGCDDWMSE